MGHEQCNRENFEIQNEEEGDDLLARSREVGCLIYNSLCNITLSLVPKSMNRTQSRWIVVMRRWGRVMAPEKNDKVSMDGSSAAMPTSKTEPATL